MEIEVSLKVRAAIKAKLLELGVHVDDELPDYIMVLVANRRTKQQMESDLELFLSENTIKFTTWLYHVLKKLEQVTLSDPIVAPKILPVIEEGKPSSTSSSKAKVKVKESKKEKEPKTKTKHSKKVGESKTSTKVKSTDSTKATSKESEKNAVKKTSENATSKGSEKSAEKTRAKSSEKTNIKSPDKATIKSSEKITKESETSKKEVSSDKRVEKTNSKSATPSISKKSFEKSSENKVQFKLKNNLVKKTEFDRKQEEEERKVESTTKSNESSEFQTTPTSTTLTEPQQNPDSSSHSIQEDILSLGDDECGDLFSVSGEVPKETKSIAHPNDDDDEEDEQRLRQIALETKKSSIRRKLVAENVDALRGIVMNNEKENSIKRKREKEEVEAGTQARTDTNRSSISKDDPPKKLRSVVTMTTTKKTSEEYDPAQPNLHKLSSVVCVTSSQRPKRNTSNMNTNLIFKAMKEVEIENIKRPTPKQDDLSRSYRDDHRGEEREHERSRRRTRSRSKNRERDRDYVDRDYGDRQRSRGYSDGRRDRNDSTNDRSEHHHNTLERSHSPLQLFTRKNRISVKDRLGERRVSKEFLQQNEMDLEFDEEAYDSEIKAIESDINIVINVSNVRSNNSDGRSVTVESEKSKAEADCEVEIIEDKIESPVQVAVELPKKVKGYVAPNRISIRVMNSSDESEESDTEDGIREKDEHEEDSDELEVTINEDRDIDDLMPSQSQHQQEENSRERKSLESDGKPTDRLTDLRAKLAALTRTNTASYSPLGFQPRRSPTRIIINKEPRPAPFTPSYFENPPKITPTTKAPTTCKFWPTCSFGENCKYVHPKCLYGDSCTKRHMCPYKHETEAFSSLTSYVPPPPFKKQSPKYTVPPLSNQKICLFFPKCHSMECSFYHPKPCRYGINCVDSKCIHYHPGSGSIGQLKKGGKIPPIHQLKWSKEKTNNSSEFHPTSTTL